MCDPLAEVSETVLLRRARDGDTRAFDELITRNRERVYMQAFMIIRNEEDACDLCQEAFVKAWRSLHRFDGKFSFAGWMRKIVSNAAIDLCRARARRPQVGLGGGELRPDAASRTTPSGGEVPGAGADREMFRARIAAAFEALSPEHRQVIVLKEIEDLSYREIAKEAGCSTGTVMSRLFYARKKLQALLSNLKDER
ncbi:MAG: RNA polymerase sigma factor RpoE [Terrimicrobiaceae bacterium]